MTAAEEESTKSVGIGASNSDKVRDHSQKLFENDLSQVMSETVNRVLSDYVVRPY